MQRILEVRLGLIERELASMAQNYNAIPGMLAGVTGSGGQQAGTNGSVENVLVELAKVQFQVRALAQSVANVQSRVEGAENLLPTMHAMKSQTESYCNKARLEVNKDIKRGDEKNQQQIMQIWEKISQKQEQKFEARIQSLEKLHATHSANLVRRVDELHKENGNLRA